MSAKTPTTLEQIRNDIECAKILTMVMTLVNHKQKRPHTSGAILERAMEALANAQLYQLMTGNLNNLEHTQEFKDALALLQEFSEEICSCPECKQRAGERTSFAE